MHTLHSFAGGNVSLPENSDDSLLSSIGTRRRCLK